MASIVCLNADHRYNDNNGAYTIFTLYNTETKEIRTEGGMYSDLNYDAYHVTNDLTIVRDASKEWEATAERKQGVYNKYAQRKHFQGCVVVLSRSRKAPNKTPLKVLKDFDGGRNGRFFEPDQILVELPEGGSQWVNASCIAEVVQGVYDYPIWHISEKEFKAKQYNVKQRKMINNKKRLTKTEKISFGIVREHFKKLTPEKRAKTLETIGDLWSQTIIDFITK